MSTGALLLLWMAALSSLGTFVLVLLRERVAWREARAEKDRRWSLHWADSFDDAPLRCLRLRLHDVERHKCRLKTVSVTDPGGARLAPQVFPLTAGAAARTSRADRTGLSRRIALARDLDGTSAPLAGHLYDDAYFYAYVPKKPFWRFSRTTTLRLVCRVTEIDRHARRRKIVLRSPPVDWAETGALGVRELRELRDKIGR